MDLKQLKAAGGIVTGDQMTKVSKTWTNPDGQEFELDFFVRRQSFYDVESLYLTTQEQTGPKAAKRQSSNAQLIAQSIRLGKAGEVELSYEDACRLEPTLAQVFITAIHELQLQKKSKRQVKKSGTSSSSPASADEPSRKPSET